MLLDKQTALASYDENDVNLIVLLDDERNDAGDDVVAEVEVRTGDQQFAQAAHGNESYTLSIT